jgi:hypothetical protein
MVDPSSDEVGATWALWQASFASSGDARRAWKTVLAAMMQDVRVAYY